VREALRLVDGMTPDETNERSQNTKSKEYYMIMSSKLPKAISWDRQRGSCVNDNVKDYASGLSNEQCMIVIEVFSPYEDQLSVEVVEALEPILLVVLRAVVAGCYQVMEYFDVRDCFEDLQLVEVLKELEWKRKPMYLREWKVRDEE
jgi:hypothetical protein